MSFTEFAFYPYLLLVFIVNTLLPHKTRWVGLLLASYAFYALVSPVFVPVLFLCTAITYGCARMIEGVPDRRKKAAWLRLGLILLILILLIFKYAAFWQSALNLSESARLLMPLGLSFYTLQTIGYLLDVYRGAAHAEKNPAKLALFVSFFPQLISGPIARVNQLLPQLLNPTLPNHDRLIRASVRIGWGLMKKLLLANRLAVIADAVFNAPSEHPAPRLAAGILAFSLQIYIDFSAYTDIAIGTASLLGIDLVENFRQPYFAASPIEFWRRWHISLSNWLRDYIFLPLEFSSRRKHWKPLLFKSASAPLLLAWRDNFYHIRNIMLTFLISGLWHGADFTFLVWGGLHGAFQAGETLLTAAKKPHAPRHPKRRQLLQRMLTFSLVSLAWVFFRSHSLENAFIMLERIFTLQGVFNGSSWSLSGMGLGGTERTLLIILLIAFGISEYLANKTPVIERIIRQPLALRWAIFFAALVSLFIFGYYGGSAYSQFLYFQF